MELLKENIGVSLHHLGFGKGFLDMTQKAKQWKKMGKVDFIKLKTFVFQIISL